MYNFIISSVYGAPFEERKLPIRSDIISLITAAAAASVVSSSSAAISSLDMSDLSVEEENIETKSVPNLEQTDSTQLSIFKWEQFLELAGVKLTKNAIQTFYIEKWLPFCVNISRERLFTNTKLLPEPFAALSSHSPVTKGLCSLFMQRQRMLRAMRLVISKYPFILQSYLRQNIDRYALDMPIWWCPWIHDIALMVGCLKHGFLHMEKICVDKDLPFWHEYTERQKDSMSSSQAPESNECCIDAMLPLFDQCSLERRITAMLADLTTSLPGRHVCHIFNSLVVYSSDGSTLTNAPKPTKRGRKPASSETKKSNETQSNGVPSNSESSTTITQKFLKRGRLFASENKHLGEQAGSEKKSSTFNENVESSQVECTGGS